MNYKLTDEINEKVESFNKFQKDWINKIDTMKLEDYTSQSDKNTFTYQIEFGMRELGSIKGGYSWRLGVYNRKNQEHKDNNSTILYSEDKQYAWMKKLGHDKETAFEQVKKEVIRIRDLVMSSELASLKESIFGPTYRWKIAFHFQNEKKPLIIPIFKEEALISYLKENDIYKEKMSIDEMHEAIITKYSIKNIEETFFIADVIWKLYIGEFSPSEERSNLSANKQKKNHRNATTALDEIEYYIKNYRRKYKPKHYKLEQSFLDYLNKKNVIDVNQNSNFIDIIYSHNNVKYICELKPTADEKEIKYAIRASLGQLFDYSFHCDCLEYKKVIVFQGKPRGENLDFLKYLKNQHDISYLYEERMGVFKGNI